MTSPAPHDTSEPAITVLFVDDEPAILRFIVRALQGAPFQVLAAESASEALALMRERPVDVLVSDMDMPGMSGPALVARVRREFPATLRMLLTGSASLSGALEAINEGEVHRFFSKPFDVDLFAATMRDLRERIEKQRREGEAEAHAARRTALHRWIEEEFPGTLAIQRGPGQEIQVDVRPEDLALLDAPAARVG